MFKAAKYQSIEIISQTYGVFVQPTVTAHASVTRYCQTRMAIYRFTLYIIALETSYIFYLYIVAQVNKVAFIA